jgi:hypothetical protein
VSKKQGNYYTSNSPQYYRATVLCFMDSFLGKALPFIRELGGGEDGRVHSEKKDKE